MTSIAQRPRVYRQISVHSEAGTDPVQVCVNQDTGWIGVALDRDESLAVFLTAPQMRLLADRLVYAAEQLAPTVDDARTAVAP